MTARASVRFAWSLWTVITAIAAVAVAVLVVVGFASPDDAFGFPGFAAVLGVTFATVGAVVASRRPANAIGWIFLTSGFCAVVQEFAMSYGVLAYREPLPSLPGAAHAAWLVDWIWIPYTGGTLIFLLLLFPHGRLPGRQWRPVVALATVGMLIAFVGEFLGPGRLATFSAVDNPLALLGSERVANMLGALGFILFGLAGIMAVVGLTRRWRMAWGAERQQYKWLLASGGLAGFTFGLGAADRVAAGEFGATVPFLLELVLILGLGGIPVAVGIAITRYHLYEIDRLISRTVAYALVVGTLVGVYAGGVILLRSLLPLEGDPAVAASTLVVASLFHPLRQRVQRRVDRRFNRSHYAAQQELERFARRLRDELDLDSLTDDLLVVVANTVQPSTATLWIPEIRR